jgi:REP element-mobilizing transposase RayT
MPYRKESPDLHEFYHIYNRGNNKEPIFFERENYLFFLRQFLKYFPLAIAEIHAFCLMPNHYHFLVRFIKEIDVSTRMKYFGISYAKAINNRYERTGHLFEGRFKIKHVDSDEYLLHLSRYIHLNPFFAKLVCKAEDWEFSSYRIYLSETDSRSFSSDTIRKLRESSMSDGLSPDTIGKLRESFVSDDFGSYVNADVILSRFGSSLEYKDFVESFAEEKMKEIEESLWR